ncbi:hypothetical protein NDU88_006550, partial [Pleurodeles waltl]
TSALVFVTPPAARGKRRFTGCSRGALSAAPCVVLPGRNQQTGTTTNQEAQAITVSAATANK